jgi:hypothetical protein
MSLVSCHAMGMLRSVMRALTHPEAAHALRGQRPSSQSSAANTQRSDRKRLLGVGVG